MPGARRAPPPSAGSPHGRWSTRLTPFRASPAALSKRRIRRTFLRPWRSVAAFGLALGAALRPDPHRRDRLPSAGVSRSGPAYDRSAGLGLITGAADDDPSAIGTYATVGALH